MKLETYLFENGISRQQFAERVGVTEASLCRYMSGVRFPRERVIRAIVEATGGAVTPNDFLDVGALSEEPAQ